MGFSLNVFNLIRIWSILFFFLFCNAFYKALFIGKKCGWRKKLCLEKLLFLNSLIIYLYTVIGVTMFFFFRPKLLPGCHRKISRNFDFPEIDSVLFRLILRSVKIHNFLSIHYISIRHSIYQFVVVFFYLKKRLCAILGNPIYNFLFCSTRFSRSQFVSVKRELPLKLLFEFMYKKICVQLNQCI